MCLRENSRSGFLESLQQECPTPLLAVIAVTITEKEWNAMKVEESQKRPYESPKATVVPVQLEERVLGCNFSTVKNCGLTE